MLDCRKALKYITENKEAGYRLYSYKTQSTKITNVDKKKGFNYKSVVPLAQMSCDMVDGDDGEPSTGPVEMVKKTIQLFRNQDDYKKFLRDMIDYCLYLNEHAFDGYCIPVFTNLPTFDQLRAAGYRDSEPAYHEYFGCEKDSKVDKSKS